MGRKRRRSRAFPAEDEEDEEQPEVTIEESESAQHQSSKSSADEGETNPEEELSEERQKELEVWDAFKEEHHEVLEQLPLSLHRQFKLIRELDSQSEAFQKGLLASVRRYILLRESLAVQHTQDASDPTKGSQSYPMDLDEPDVNVDPASNPPQSAEPVDSAGPPPAGDAVTGNARAGSTISNKPPPFQPKLGETTRALLQLIAQTSEEAIRTVEEKVSIAQTAYETVDRHIRLLDQAIKEQEAAISLGMRPGTHLAPILLPDLVVPRWARPPRVEHSPVPSLSPELELRLEEPPNLELPAPVVPSPKVPKKGRKSAAPKTPKSEEAQPLGETEEPLSTGRTRRSGVRLTIPAQSQPQIPTVPADPNEDRYCYCNQVSFGTMIACDNDDCEKEWFHLGCTGLSDVPSKKTKWYCRDCKAKMTQKGRSR